MQYDSLRPLIVPCGSFEKAQTELWESPEHFLEIENVGKGVATNLWGVILPPTDPSRDTSYQFSLRASLPLGSGKAVRARFERGGTLFTPEDTIENITLGVPKERAPAATLPDFISRRDRCVARLTLSYHDVFGLKHASIFDLTTTGVWVCVDVRKGISKDLSDLDAAKER